MIKALRKRETKLSGTFVTDCPKCHKHFYGWDKHESHVKLRDELGKIVAYRIVCHRCSRLKQQA